MTETPETIFNWAEETFGKAKSNFLLAARADMEMVELLDMLQLNDNDGEAVDEIADIVILLSRLFHRLKLSGHHNFDSIDEAVDVKMQRNRKRKWKLDGKGTGQHTEEG